MSSPSSSTNMKCVDLLCMGSLRIFISCIKSVQNSDIVATAVHLAAQPEFIATVAAMPHEEVLYMVALMYVGMKVGILQAAVPDRAK
ncbi:hypothetical protein K488DRAFT_81831 [Vararia minispora EC-137]|uniref:Uncharacterized protein n=1 Tax=Vararia minispora EC-137 TaxID=1314806 RepID=A0ACB8QYW3_9AGAM|nr:hypothetical protein K488DRAFT_81831 [Vararia minispora EC-137]